jgi:hypothetical protein
MTHLPFTLNFGRMITAIIVVPKESIASVILLGGFY